MQWWSLEIPRTDIGAVVEFVQDKWDYEVIEDYSEYGDIVLLEVCCEQEDLADIDEQVQSIADDEFNEWF